MVKLIGEAKPVNIPVTELDDHNHKKVVVKHSSGISDELVGHIEQVEEPRDKFFGQSALQSSIDQLLSEPEKLPESELRPENALSERHLERAKILFAPVLDDGDNNDSKEFDFSKLFGEREIGTAEWMAANRQQQVDERKKKARQPTKESISEARRWLSIAQSHDEALYQIIHGFIQENGGRKPEDRDPIRLLRTEPELRVRVGVHFLNKVDKMAKVGWMPRRVAVNEQKNPGHLGYPDTMSSREYAALLALSRIDGTFKDSDVTSTDVIEYDNEKQVRLGHHRAAAEILLNRSV